MTATSVTRGQQGPQAERSWHLAFLTKTELGRRNRRPVDSIVLIVGAGVAGLSAVIVSSAPKQDRDVANALMTILGWAGGLWRTAFVALLLLALLVAVDVVLRARWDLARDLLVAAALLVGVATLLGGSVTSNWALVESHPLADWGYPDLRLALATAPFPWGWPAARLCAWRSEPRLVCRPRPTSRARWRSSASTSQTCARRCSSVLAPPSTSGTMRPAGR